MQVESLRFAPLVFVMALVPIAAIAGGKSLVQARAGFETRLTREVTDETPLQAPPLNGKVERSHRTDREEFYQLLIYKGDVDLEKKLVVWGRVYNNDRPHGAHAGKTPHEILLTKPG